ncbi:hypothetical protein BJ165DRAFT_1526549 [Panaeolus papilionaceus]|nr:hypothetical protein BJ165DRAFT_1526549 [Panaeolus papilionaceus]
MPASRTCRTTARRARATTPGWGDTPSQPIFVGSSPIQPPASCSTSSTQPAIQPAPAPNSAHNPWGNNPSSDNEPSGWSAPSQSPWGPSAWDSSSSWHEAQFVLSSDEEDASNIASTTLPTSSVAGASQIVSSFNSPPSLAAGPSRPRTSLPNLTEPIQTTSRRACSTSPTPHNAQTPLQRQISRHRAELAANRRENPNETCEEIESIQSLILSSLTLARDLPSSFFIQPSNSRVPRTPTENQHGSTQTNTTEPVSTESEATESVSTHVQPMQADAGQAGTQRRRRRPPTLQERRHLATEAAERRRLEIQEEIRAHLEEGLRAESSMMNHL